MISRLIARPRHLLLLALLVGVIPSVAGANGGTSIANAPELPLGQQVSGAKPGLDYWRVNILSGDLLRIDYEPVATRQIALCLMAPNITDFTVNDAGCTDSNNTDSADRKRQTLHELTLPGRYTLIIGYWSGSCVATGSGGVDTRCNQAMGFNLTAFVVHRTTTTLLSVPRSVRRGSTVTVRGQVQGADRGNVVLQQRVGKRWVNKQLAKIAAGGRFTIKLKAAKAGTFSYRVRFSGDSSHKSSKKAFKITVV